MEVANEYPGARAALKAMIQFLSMDLEGSKQISSNLGTSISAFASAIDALTNEENICRMQKATEAIALVIDRLSEICIDASATDDFVMLDEATVEVLQEAVPLIPEEKREEHKEIITPKQGENAKNIAISVLCQIITWILMITLVQSVSIDEETKEIMREQVAVGWEQAAIAQEQLDAEKERNDIERQKVELSDKLFEKIDELIEYVKQDRIGFSDSVNVIKDEENVIVDSKDTVVDGTSCSN